MPDAGGVCTYKTRMFKLYNQFQRQVKKLKIILMKPSEPDLHSGPHAIGRVGLAVGGVCGLTSLVYYGYVRPVQNSARTRFPLWQGYVRDRVTTTFDYYSLSTAGTTALAAKLSRYTPFVELAGRRPLFLLGSCLLFEVISGVVLLMMHHQTEGHWYLLGFTRKQVLWVIHNSFLAATIAPMCFLSGGVIVKAFLATIGLMSSLAALAIVAPEKMSRDYLTWRLPLQVGLLFVFISSGGSFIFPQTTRLGIFLFSTYLYGGLFLFPLIFIRDFQSFILSAELRPPSENFDPINAAMALCMDSLNVFIRILQLLTIKNLIL